MTTRILSASGIISAIAMVAGILLLIGEEIDTRSDAEIVDYFASGGNRTKEFVGLLLVIIGAVLFLMFLSALHTRLQQTRPAAGSLSTLALAAGVTATALLVAAGAALGATSAAVGFSSNFEVDPNLTRFFVSTGSLLLLGSMFVNCVLVLATSTLVLRTGVLPKWFAWVGFAAVPLAIAESFLYPVFVIPLWILIASAVLTMQHSPQPAAG